MKKTGFCPKCGSTSVTLIPSELGTYNQIKIDLFGSADLTRYICTSCGYMEQYVGDDEALKKLRGHAANPPGK